MANVVSSLSGRGSFVVLPSLARTATPDTQEFDVQVAEGDALHLVIDVTAIVTTPSITVTISGVDRVSGKTYTVLASAAITTVSTTVLKVGAGLVAAANLVANDVLPPVFRVTVTHGNANSITYSVVGQLI